MYLASEKLKETKQTILGCMILADILPNFGLPQVTRRFLCVVRVDWFCCI